MRKKFYHAYNKKLIATPIEEPMRRNRFSLRFDEHFNIPEFAVQRADLPHYNLQNMSWEEMSIDIIDLYGHGISTSSSMINLIDYCKDRKLNGELEMFTIRMSSLDPTGVVIETFVIVVESVKVNFGELDYSSSDVRYITLTIKPTCCIIE